MHNGNAQHHNEHLEIDRGVRICAEFHAMEWLRRKAKNKYLDKYFKHISP